MCLGMCECMSITVYCCCCRSHWALPCSCGPSTGPHCWRRHVVGASSRWSGPDLWPPRNCWSDAVGRSLGWLRRQAGTHPHEHRHTQIYVRALELIFNMTFSRILCIQTPGCFEGNIQSTEMDKNSKPHFIHSWNEKVQAFPKYSVWFISPFKCFNLSTSVK